MVVDYRNYYERVGTKPNHMLLSVLGLYAPTRVAALDLGAGNLRDAKFLRHAGFERVVAVDCSPQVLGFDPDGVEVCISLIEEYQIEEQAYDLIIACNALFWIDKDDLSALFRSILRGLKKGGIFACNLIGADDDWVRAGRNVTWVTKSDILRLAEGFKVLGVGDVHFDQTSHDGRSSKNWHTWSVGLRKV